MRERTDSDDTTTPGVRAGRAEVKKYFSSKMPRGVGRERVGGPPRRLVDPVGERGQDVVVLAGRQVLLLDRRHLVGGESSGAPLSDDRIVDLLKGEGIEIARRTVAKYREAMRIPSSAERRRLGRLGMSRSVPAASISLPIAAEALAGPAD